MTGKLSNLPTWTYFFIGPVICQRHITSDSLFGSPCSVSFSPKCSQAIQNVPQNVLAVLEGFRDSEEIMVFIPFTTPTASAFEISIWPGSTGWSHQYWRNTLIESEVHDCVVRCHLDTDIKIPSFANVCFLFELPVSLAILNLSLIQTLIQISSGAIN